MTRFHEHLYQLVLKERPAVMVETGYATGLSAMHILAAMDINGKGKLYSVESFTNQDIFHPRLKYVRGFSHDVLNKIYNESGPWDMFLHDSDHGLGCQTFEYELSWRCLNTGGILISDDIEWGDPPHFAWKHFLGRHDHSDLTTIGCAQHCRKLASDEKPLTHPGYISDAFTVAKKVANQICKESGVEEYLK